MRYYRRIQYDPSVSRYEDCTNWLRSWFIRVFILGLLGGVVVGLYAGMRLAGAA